MLQRFQLLVYPDEPGGEPTIVDELPDSRAKNQAFAIIKTLSEMDFTAHGAEIEENGKIPFFHFGLEAQEFFYKWYLKLEARRRSEGEDVMVEHLSKFDSLMPSLALIFHLIEIANWALNKVDAPQGPLFPEPPKQISLQNAKLAAEWCDYLESHAWRIYGLAANVSVQAAKKLLEKIRDGSLEDGFNAREVYSQNWSFLDSKKLAQAAIDELVETGWLREIPPPEPQKKGGRPFTPTYRIHPKAREILKKERTAE